MIEASTVSPDAVLGAVVTCTLFLCAALWKLATMLAEIRAEIRTNGGGSVKDRIRAIGLTVDQIQADTGQNKTSLARIDDRVSDHRRRQDAQILLLREHIDKRIDTLTEGQLRSDAIRSALHELGATHEDDLT